MCMNLIIEYSVFGLTFAACSEIYFVVTSVVGSGTNSFPILLLHNLDTAELKSLLCYTV